MSALEPGQIFAKDFRIERRLSEGGMGAVYVARQLSTDKQRALKLMHPKLVPDARSRQRFMDEARIGSRIESEHVVEVVAAGIDETSGAPWLAMELLEGEDLGALSARRGPLPVGEVRDVFQQAGHALALAHAANIVHRDLKPENLFLARARRQGQASVVKVLDFGIAMALPSGGAGVVTTTIGSPFWMAPEQAKPGSVLAPSTDVWALGLIAYQLLSGGSYWRTAKVVDVAIGAVLTEILVEPLSSASERAEELGFARLPPGFDGWFARCVCREQSGRFADAKTCLDALDEVLAKTSPRVAVTFSTGEMPQVVLAAPFEATMPRATPYPAPNMTADTKPSLAPVAPLSPSPLAEERADRPSPQHPPGAKASADTKPSLTPVSSAGALASSPQPARPREERGSRAGVFIGLAGVLVAIAAVWWSQRAVEVPPAPTVKIAPAPPPVVVPAEPLAVVDAGAVVEVAPPVVDAGLAMAAPVVDAELAMAAPVVDAGLAMAPPVPRRPRPHQQPVDPGPFSAVKVVGETCAAGRLVSVAEAQTHTRELCDLLGQWDIARLQGGGSLNGKGYGCKVNPRDKASLGHALCRQ